MIKLIALLLVPILLLAGVISSFARDLHTSFWSAAWVLTSSGVAIYVAAKVYTPLESYYGESSWIPLVGAFSAGGGILYGLASFVL